VSQPRLTLQRGVTMSMIAALTTWVTLLSWRGFVRDSGHYLGPLLTLGLAIAALGALARWARLPLSLVALLQLLLAGGWLLALYGGSPVPSPEAVGGLATAFREAVHTAQAYQAPVPQTVPSVTPLLVAGGAACLVLVDLLAAGLGRVPLAGLPLLLIYSLPVSILGSGVNWLVFVLVSAGFLTLLFLREDERFSQWGRQVVADPRSGDPTGFGVRTGSARGNAVAIGSTVTALAHFVPIIIPELQVGLFSGGVGNGPGQGVSIVNPIADLRRDLHRGSDVPLLTVDTDDPAPSYIKVSVLTNFNGEAWTTGDRKIPSGQVANGTTMPPMQGLSPLQVQTTPHSYAFQATNDLEAHWLPVPDLVTSANAPGVWKYDLTTRDFISGEATQTSEGLSWTATGIDAKYDANRLAAAPEAPSLIQATYTSLPTQGIPPNVRELAAEVTRDKATAYEKAVALQNWFRAPGRFTYTLEVNPANGSDALEQFLGDGPEGRRGYCEQFASAFAVMARSLRIPARVVVGFLNPEPITAGRYEFSSWDLHAWPEVYFEGAGWVRFEPTPGNGAAVPGYTRQRVSQTPITNTPTATTTGEDIPSRPASPTSGPNQQTGQGDHAGSRVAWIIAGGVGGGMLVLLLLSLVPRVLRSSRRGARRAAGTEATWAELRDSVLDLRLPWPVGRSPQATRDVLASLLAADDGSQRPPLGADANPEAAAALDALVHALELERYSGRPLVADPHELDAAVTTVVASLAAGVPASARRLAVWWPRSLRRPTGAETGIKLRSGRDGVVDRV
jgi:transglutaminase-like putative cysteine protease